MNPRQKRIVTILAMVNGIVILGLVALLLRGSGSASPSPLPAPAAAAPRRTGTSPLTVPPPASTAEATARALCQWQAAQYLAQAGLGGTVHLAPDVLRFDLVQAAGETPPLDPSTEAIWTAFDIALSVMGNGCTMFDHVEVSILTQGDHRSGTNARVRAADLAAFGTGELSEEAFIQRVTYEAGER
jgi:hypothetical protein